MGGAASRWLGGTTREEERQKEQLADQVFALLDRDGSFLDVRELRILVLAFGDGTFTFPTDTALCPTRDGTRDSQLGPLEIRHRPKMFARTATARS